MRSWDASAILPLLIAGASTSRPQVLAAKDPDMLVWWGSEVECVSALARLEHDAMLDPLAAMLAVGRLKQLAAGWHEIDPSDIVRETAARFLRVHALRPAAALRLAAPFVAAEQRPSSLEMVTLDDRPAVLRGRKDLSWSVSCRTKGPPGNDRRAARLLACNTAIIRHYLAVIPERCCRLEAASAAPFPRFSDSAGRRFRRSWDGFTF